MNRKIKDGIVIDRSVTIIEDKRTGYPITVRIVQFLAIVIGIWSVSAILIDSFRIPVSTYRVNLAILLSAAVIYPLYLYRSFDILKQFFGALFYVLFFLSRLPKLKNAFYILENLVLDRIKEYYGYEALYYNANYSAAKADTTLLIIMILIPLVALLGVAVVRGGYISLAGMVLFLPVAASFAFGIIPSEKYLLVFVITMIYIFRSGSTQKNTVNKNQIPILHRINSRAAIWLSLLGIVIFFMMKLVVTPEDYKGVTQIEKMKTNIQTAMYNFSLDDVTKSISNIQLGPRTKAVGGLSGGTLGKVGQVEYTNTEHLVLTAPLPSVDEGIYLKGYVGTVYTGDRWEGLSNEDKILYRNLSKKLPGDEFQPVNQVNQLLELISSNSDDSSLGKEHFPKFSYSSGFMKVQYKAANEKFMYAPYFTNYELIKQKEYRQDLYAAPTTKNDSYIFYYRFNVNMNDDTSLLYFNQMKDKFGDYSNLEKRYRDYVYKVYTELPKNGIDRIKKDFTPNTVLTGTNEIPAKIAYVKNYLSDNTRYSLSPGKLPKGKDFVEYFLYENKEGYCAHYASAATLMLRSMGVPARYVEGYAVSKSDIVGGSKLITIGNYNDSTMTSGNAQEAEVSVKDYNAHAWVEVYIDNCGWIPVEFTPGSAVEYNNSVVQDIAAIGENIEPDKADQPELTEAPKEPTPTEKPKKELQPTSKPKQDATVTGENTKKKPPTLGRLFLITGLTIVIIGILLIVYYIVMRRRKVLGVRNRSKRAIYIFAEIEKLLTLSNSLPKKGNRLEDSIEYVKEHCPYIDTKKFTTCIETVRKARFGKLVISTQELREVEDFRSTLYQKVYYDLPVIKKLYLRLLMLI